MRKRNPMICIAWGVVIGLIVGLLAAGLLGFLISGESVAREQGGIFAHLARGAGAFLAAAVTIAMCADRPGLWGLVSMVVYGCILCLVGLGLPDQGFVGLMPGLLSVLAGGGAAVLLLGIRKGKGRTAGRKMKFR